MNPTTVFAVKLPRGILAALHETCRRLGMKKSHLVAEALREKIEDLMDAYDLREAIGDATTFEPWGKAKKTLKHQGKI